jgi:four helix bundle protein
MTIRNYRDLAVWTKAMVVAKSVYGLAELMPKKEEYRLTAQMIRAAISVPANIAEGRTRATRKDFAHFISIARGSAAELETLLMLAADVSLLRQNQVDPVLEDVGEVGRMLNALHAKLKTAST